ncbi:MAG TPA: cisplatin damage response ATP-dependent DNA ligase [Sphingomonas sp.]
MKRFAQLLELLALTPSRNRKLAALTQYFREVPDPDRGYALAVLTGALTFRNVKPALLKDIVLREVDETLFAMSYDYVGDLGETIALIWPHHGETGDLPSLTDLIELFHTTSKSDLLKLIAALLTRAEINERWALVKLATGALRIGVSARLAKTALSEMSGKDLQEIEEVWHGLKVPYLDLFAWLDGAAERPDIDHAARFHPLMLSNPIDEEKDLAKLDPKDFSAEWKWDGIRVQIVHVAGQTRLYSRTGDDVTGSFPDVAASFHTPGVLDGELMVKGEFQGGEAGSFNALQQRLGRKTVSAKMLAESPAFVRLYDILFDGTEDLRALPWTERRARLEAFMPRLDPERFDLSQLIEAEDFTGLEAIRAGARDAAIEGVMLKRRDSAYIGGRRAGLWYKWKRDPLTADCVVMYAQRGNGRRSSYYSDFTFGCWTEGGELLPVGKAYQGITDEELKQLDRYVRHHTLNRFGPVRETDKTLVLEIAFDSIHLSARHKSGLAMRFPRIARIRTDKPAAEADRIETLRRLVT